MNIDDLIAGEAPHLLPLEEKARRRILPNSLSVKNIVQLWVDDEAKQKMLARVLSIAVENGELKSSYREDVWMEDYKAGLGYRPTEKVDPMDTDIYREDFEAYLRHKNLWPVKGCLLVNWWTGSEEKNLENDEENEFERRLAVLKNWLISLRYSLDDGTIKLPKEYTPNKIHIELNKFSSDEKLFDLTLGSFERHFWQRQKIAEIPRGRKPATKK